MKELYENTSSGEALRRLWLEENIKEIVKDYGYQFAMCLEVEGKDVVVHLNLSDFNLEDSNQFKSISYFVRMNAGPDNYLILFCDEEQENIYSYCAIKVGKNFECMKQEYANFPFIL